MIAAPERAVAILSGAVTILKHAEFRRKGRIKCGARIWSPSPLSTASNSTSISDFELRISRIENAHRLAPKHTYWTSQERADQVRGEDLVPEPPLCRHALVGATIHVYPSQPYSWNPEP